MSPVLSAEGEKINWINYKTGIRNLSFQMDASQDTAQLSINIMHRDDGYAYRLYEQFELLQLSFEEELQETWNWEKNRQSEHQQFVSSISIQLSCNVYKESDWPDIISFLKPRIIKLDKFWCDHKMIFEMII